MEQSKENKQKQQQKKAKKYQEPEHWQDAIDLSTIKGRKEKEAKIFTHFNDPLEKMKKPDPERGVEPTCCHCLKKKPVPPQRVEPFNFKNSIDPQFQLKSVVIIYNPYSGNGRGRKNFPIIKESLEKAKVNIIKIFETKHFNHAQEIAEDTNEQDIDKADAIICTGGDGTLNEIVNGLMKRSKKQGKEEIKYIGYVPGGTANDAGETLYGHEDRYNVPHVMNKIINGKPYGTDLMQITCFNNKKNQEETIYSHLCCLWGIGVKANITAAGLRCLGVLRYDVGIITQIIKGGNEKTLIQVDDGPKIKLTTNVAFALNHQYLADSLLSTPGAQIDDGYIDVVLFENTTRCQTIDVFEELKRSGSHIYNDKILYGHGKKLKFETLEPTLIQLDGEDHRDYQTPYTMEVLPKRLVYIW